MIVFICSVLVIIGLLGAAFCLVLALAGWICSKLSK